MKRSSGVLMHISSLWGDYSSGAFGAECMEFIDFLQDSGFTYWQVLPFCLPDDCNSPYKSYSAFSGNPFFIDLNSLYDDGLLTKDELNSARQESPYSCEFERLKNSRLKLLEIASNRFLDTKKIDDFFNCHIETLDFCKFMALKKSNSDLAWNEWTNTTPDEQTFKLWKFIQYTFFTQWKKIKKYANEKGISIIGDIPIYVSYDSSDVWANPELFQLDKKNLPVSVAGVPPDYFCEDGQLWGNPLYDWDKMELDNFSWWRSRMKFMTELFDGVRIDHFRGLESYYSVLATETTARNGKWIKGPGLKFINTIKEVCKDKLIIAEDLGIITEDVEKLVEDSGFPGMRVLQFGFFGNDPTSPHLPHNYINNCIAYTGTHDNNTLLGFVWELSPEDRNHLLSYIGYKNENWDNCYDEILRTMFSSHAGTLILPIQDLLLYGSDTRFNTPGKSFGNWSFRITKEQLNTISKEKFKTLNELYGRISQL